MVSSLIINAQNWCVWVMLTLAKVWLQTEISQLILEPGVVENILPCCLAAFSICVILIFTATSQNEIVNTFLVFSHNPMVTIKTMWTWLTSLRQSRKPFMSQYQSVCWSQWMLNSYISSVLILTDWLWPKSWNSSGSTTTVDENTPHCHILHVSVCVNQSLMTSVFCLLHQSEHVLI